MTLLAQCSLSQAAGLNLQEACAAGCEFGDHTHSCDKRDAILSGKFFFRMGGEEVRSWTQSCTTSQHGLMQSRALQVVLKAGDMLDVPAGKVHYAKVLEGPCTFVDGTKR